MKSNITFESTETDLSLDIKITANLLEYTCIFPKSEVLSIRFNMNRAKGKIPLILGLNKHEHLEIRNYVVTEVSKYKTKLKW